MRLMRLSRRLRPEDWTWREVAAWIDTEGTFYVGKRITLLLIPQKERDVLDSMKLFFEKHRIPSRVTFDRVNSAWRLEISRIGDIHKVLERTFKFFRTKVRRRQAEQARARLKMPQRIPIPFRVAFPFDPKKHWWDPW